jgi:hypothetical protein
MVKGEYQESESVIWEMNKTMAKISQRKKLIELLQEYNQQDEQRMIELARYN